MSTGEDTVGIGGKSNLDDVAGWAALELSPGCALPFAASFRFLSASFFCCSSCSKRERRIASITIN